MRINPEVRRDIGVTAQMSRSSDGNFYLTIEDNASGCVIVQVSLDSDAIADLISNRYTQPMPCEYYANPNIGKIHTAKRVEIGIPTLNPPLFEYSHNYEKDLELVYGLAEHLNPGWTADRDDFNSKRKTKDGYSVTIRKYE